MSAADEEFPVRIHDQDDDWPGRVGIAIPMSQMFAAASTVRPSDIEGFWVQFPDGEFGQYREHEFERITE